MAEKNLYFVTNLLRNTLVDIHSITLAMGLLHTYLQVLLEYYCLHKKFRYYVLFESSVTHCYVWRDHLYLRKERFNQNS